MFLEDKQIIVIDGSDGAGKETVSRGLVAYLNSIGIKAERVSFPMYDTPKGHRLAIKLGKTDIDAYAENKIKNAEYLRKLAPGETPEQLLPENFLQENWQVAARDFAEERAANIKHITDSSADVIVCDRYTLSNMAYQAAKHYMKAYDRNGLSSTKNIEWADCIVCDHARQIADMEYNEFGIPEPNKTIFLHRPYENAMKAVAERGEKMDVNESNSTYQSFVERTYKMLAGCMEMETVETMDAKGQMRDRGYILAEVAGATRKHLGIPFESKDEVLDIFDFAKDFYANNQQSQGQG